MIFYNNKEIKIEKIKKYKTYTFKLKQEDLKAVDILDKKIKSLFAELKQRNKATLFKFVIDTEPLTYEEECVQSELIFTLAPWWIMNHEVKADREKRLSVPSKLLHIPISFMTLLKIINTNSIFPIFQMEIIYKKSKNKYFLIGEKEEVNENIDIDID